ncbi:DUF3006 domain-containing protein [Rubrobacter indicoceani]|uniref:DUF3006 domain-containing protein n=1 Tax=Rubrobacter indicoceani TaxID=2051957 RepID=UPI000E5AD566|nr:DUF3006 domain-containing protein [Rubrobacter indicoceani]
MYVQLERIEDESWAVLMPYPEGDGAFDLPVSALPDGAKPGDIFKLRLVPDADRTREARLENTALLEELLGGTEETGTDQKDRQEDG